jgi:GT2 family glycosyltransferase
MKHYDVIIATPGNKMESSYVKSLTETLSECDKRGISYIWINKYSSLVHSAREATASDSMVINPMSKGPMHDSATYNKIFWIDSDISWDVDSFFKLYDSELDIVSGVYLYDNLKSNIIKSESLGFYTKDEILKLEHVEESHGVGFGFVCIKKGVLENMPRPWFSHILKHVVREDGVQYDDLYGEDISFCIRANKSGFKNHFDPTVLVNHIKQVALSWGEDSFKKIWN